MQQCYDDYEQPYSCLTKNKLTEWDLFLRKQQVVDDIGLLNLGIENAVAEHLIKIGAGNFQDKCIVVRFVDSNAHAA